MRKTNRGNESWTTRCLYILLIGIGTYFNVTGTPVVGSVIYLVAFALLIILNKESMNIISIVITVMCAIVILYVGILSYL